MRLKDDVKRRLNTGGMIDSETLWSQIEEYSYISFDIFDTLVKRNFDQPADVFSYMERLVGDDFKKKRIRAEQEARRKLNKSEVTIKDIYYFYPGKSNKEALIKQELETEFACIVPNSPVAEVFRRCVQEGKTVYLTSDLYWPEKAVESLLEKNGFVGYTRIYLSATWQEVKSDGSLFVTLLREEQIEAGQLVHIGDSLVGDYREPQKLGIHAVKIPRYFASLHYLTENDRSSTELNYLNHFINNTFSGKRDPYYRFGYAQFGKLLFGYSGWIHDEARKRGIEKLFFFSRDGFVMKQAFDLCFDDMKTHYLEVSRRSLRGAILWMDCSFETALDMVVNAKLVSIASIFDGLGLEIDSYEEEICRNGLTKETVFDRTTIWEDVGLRHLFNELKPDIIRNSHREHNMLRQYLEQEHVRGCFGVVDIGYGGSMQRYLLQMLTEHNIPNQVSGFYLGVAEFNKKNMVQGVEPELNGYLFDFQHDRHAVDSRRSFVGLFETLFLEQGGSVKRYIADGERIVAERYPYEHARDGKPVEDHLKIKRLQQGALDFVGKAARDLVLVRMKFQPEDLFRGLYQTGTHPGRQELLLFADMDFYDEGMTEKLACPKKIRAYIKAPGELKHDFLRCRWKIGFLKRLFRIRLPYQQMYQLMLKLR